MDMMYKDGGVIFYQDANGVYNDINVEVGVSEVTFEENWYDLNDIDKQFPDVKVLHIKRPVMHIGLSNYMFPNVREVVSESSYYASGSMLVEIFKHERQLVNTFCLRDDETLNLDGVNSIQEYALEGCMTKNVINENDVRSCTVNAFSGSIFEKEHVARLGNTVLLQVESDSSEYVVPDDIQCIADSVDFSNIETVTVHDIVDIMMFSNVKKVFETLRINNVPQNNLSEDSDYIFLMQGVNKAIRVKNIEFINNGMFTSIDGIVYTNYKKELLVCPRYKSGTIEIPAGVKEISDRAFLCSHISGVKLPDSVTTINSYAFAFCAQLSDFQFGKGLLNIHSYAFYRCYKLEYITIPSGVHSIGPHAFDSCIELKSVHLNDTLESIGQICFNGTYKLKELELPASLKVVGHKSLLGLSCITVENVPECFIDAITTCSDNDYVGGVPYITIHTPDKTCYVPKYVNTRAWTSIKLPDMETDTLYTYAKTVQDKQDTAIAIYKNTKSAEAQKYLRKTGLQICQRFLESGDEESLVQFIGMIPLTKQTLNTLLQRCSQQGLTVACAYLLNELRKLKKDRSFQV